MLTTVTFTANSKVGNLSRLILAVRRLGYRAVEQSLEKSTYDALDLIKLTLESTKILYDGDFAEISKMVPTIVNVKVDNPAVVQQSSTTINQSSSRQPAIHNTFAASNRAMTLSADEVSALVKNAGRDLIANYPNIYTPLQELETRLPESARQEVLSKLGLGIGRWQYKKNFSLGGRLPLDKVIQRSLKIALSDFLTVTAYGTAISVTNCPHCTNHRISHRQECYFISSFITGFMSETSHLGEVHVQQMLNSAQGASTCEFEVK